MNKCKFCTTEATWSVKERYDIINGDPHSSSGIWIEDRMGICTKFEEADIQWNKR